MIEPNCRKIIRFEKMFVFFVFFFMWMGPNCRKITLIESNSRKIILFEKSEIFLCGLDQIVGKFLQFEKCGLNKIVRKYLQFERRVQEN